MVVLLISVLVSAMHGLAAENDPETVLVTYHIKESKGDALAQLIDRAWITYQRLGMVLDRPHLVLRGKEKGGMFMAEILPWKSHSMPDNAPAVVSALWDEMQTLCGKRDGHDVIEIPEVQLLRNDS
jgi:hypothetical protein